MKKNIIILAIIIAIIFGGFTLKRLYLNDVSFKFNSTDKFSYNFTSKYWVYFDVEGSNAYGTLYLHKINGNYTYKIPIFEFTGGTSEKFKRKLELYEDDYELIYTPCSNQDINQKGNIELELSIRGLIL